MAKGLKDKNGDLPYTMIPNRLIRSQELDPYEKLVFITIASCNPSFPSYEVIHKWTGMSTERIWKSLKRLEECRVIRRFKRGRAVEYKPWYISSPGEDDSTKSFRQANQPLRQTKETSSPDEIISLRRAKTKKTKEKDQIKRTNKKASSEVSESGSEEFSDEEFSSMLEEITERFGSVAS